MFALLFFLTIPALYYLGRLMLGHRKEVKRRNLANQLNFQYKNGIISGSMHGIPVSIGWHPGDDYKRGVTWFEIKFQQAHSFSFTLSPLPGLPDTRARPYLSRVKSGDLIFDNEVLIESKNEAGIISLLSHKVRSLILKNLFQKNLYSDFTISQSGIEVSMYKSDLKTLVYKLTILADLLQNYRSIPLRLSTNFQKDKNIKVRQKNFELLLKHYPQISNRQQLLDIAAQSFSPVLMFCAFKWDKKRRKENFLVEIWKRSWTQFKIEILKYISRQKRFTAFLIREYPACELEIKLAILKSMGRAYVPQVNRFLREQLQTADSVLFQQVLRLLTRFGTLEDVEPLLKSSHLFNRGAITPVIQAIQVRCGKQGKGWLSVSPVASACGNLSLSQGEERGSLGFPPK